MEDDQNYSIEQLFMPQKVFQDRVNISQKLVNNFFAKRLKILVISYYIYYLKIHQHVIQILVMERLKTSNVSDVSNGTTVT